MPSSSPRTYQCFDTESPGLIFPIFTVFVFVLPSCMSAKERPLGKLSVAVTLSMHSTFELLITRSSTSKICLSQLTPPVIKYTLFATSYIVLPVLFSFFIVLPLPVLYTMYSPKFKVKVSFVTFLFAKLVVSIPAFLISSSESSLTVKLPPTVS